MTTTTYGTARDRAMARARDLKAYCHDEVEPATISPELAALWQTADMMGAWARDWIVPGPTVDAALAAILEQLGVTDDSTVEDDQP
jgi:hypothetical protein